MVTDGVPLMAQWSQTMSNLNPGPKGFHITFDNGLSLSVQYGRGNYCTHYSGPDFDTPHADLGPTETVEIAVWDEDENWKLDNLVAGHVPVQALPAILSLVRDDNIIALNQMCNDQSYAY